MSQEDGLDGAGKSLGGGSAVSYFKIRDRINAKNCLRRETFKYRIYFPLRRGSPSCKSGGQGELCTHLAHVHLSCSWNTGMWGREMFFLKVLTSSC